MKEKKVIKNITIEEEEAYITTIKDCEELLDQEGESYKTPRTLFNISGKAKCTLRNAIEYALSGKLCSKIKIDPKDYPDLIYLCRVYKNAKKYSGACKAVNEKYFDKTGRTRLAFSEFITRLKARGWNFESNNKSKFSEAKAAEEAVYKASLYR